VFHFISLILDSLFLLLFLLPLTLLLLIPLCLPSLLIFLATSEVCRIFLSLILHIFLLTVHLSGRQMSFEGDFLDLFFCEAKINILRFKICVNNVAHAMKVIETHQALLGHDANKVQWYTFVVVALDDFKKVYAKDFKNHHEMFSVWPVV
jgi:hypothetical protein